MSGDSIAIQINFGTSATSYPAVYVDDVGDGVLVAVPYREDIDWNQFSLLSYFAGKTVEGVIVLDPGTTRCEALLEVPKSYTSLCSPNI